jgi:hypothetical protein
MNRIESDDDDLMLESAAQLTEKQKALFNRMLEIERGLQLSNAPTRHARNLILCWLAKKLPADSPEMILRARIQEAYWQAANFGGNIYGRQKIFPAYVYARRAA